MIFGQSQDKCFLLSPVFVLSETATSAISRFIYLSIRKQINLVNIGLLSHYYRLSGIKDLGLHPTP